MNWLLLRGLARQSKHWGEFIPVFQQNFPQDKIFCLDLPGMGSERNRNSPTSIAHICEDVRQRWLHLKESSEQPWGIVGMSLGGMVALQWMSQHEKEFSLGVIINSSDRTHASWHERLKLDALWQLLQITFTREIRPREEKILRLVSNHQDSINRSLSEWEKIAQQEPIKRHNALLQLYAASKFSLKKKPRKKLLFLSSAADRMVDTSSSRRMASSLDADFSLHPNAGHDIALDDPHWICQEISDFLSRTATQKEKDQLPSLENEALRILEEAEKKVAAKNLRNHIVVVSFDGTKGSSQDFVLKLVATLNEKNIPAQYRFAAGSVGLESGGFIMDILVPPENAKEASQIIAIEVKK